jgi:hypothetical protein
MFETKVINETKIFLFLVRLMRETKNSLLYISSQLNQVEYFSLFIPENAI